MKDNRRRLVGRVTSNKMMKTVVVQVERRQRHPLYGKVVNHSKRFMAHDELGAAMGDTVAIQNVQSKRTIQATVEGPGLVTVNSLLGPGPRVASDATGSGGGNRQIVR